MRMIHVGWTNFQYSCSETKTIKAAYNSDQWECIFSVGSKSKLFPCTNLFSCLVDLAHIPPDLFVNLINL